MVNRLLLKIRGNNEHRPVTSKKFNDSFPRKDPLFEDVWMSATQKTVLKRISVKNIFGFYTL